MHVGGISLIVQRRGLPRVGVCTGSPAEKGRGQDWNTSPLESVLFLLPRFSCLERLAWKPAGALLQAVDNLEALEQRDSGTAVVAQQL